MKRVTIDFRTVKDTGDFYQLFARSFGLEMEFGANLDALWDALTGMIALPARITLRHLQQHQDPAQFSRIIEVMREAEAALNGLLAVRIN